MQRQSPRLNSSFRPPVARSLRHVAVGAALLGIWLSTAPLAAQQPSAYAATAPTGNLNWSGPKKISPSQWSQQQAVGAVPQMARAPAFYSPTPAPTPGPMLPAPDAAVYGTPAPPPQPNYGSPVPMDQPAPAPSYELTPPPPMPQQEYAPPPAAPAPQAPMAPTPAPPKQPVSPYQEIITTPPPPPPAAPKAAAPEAVKESEVIVVEETPLPKLWTGSFDLGLNGSEGNTRLFNLRFNTQIKRATPFNELNLKANYIKTNTNAIETANRLFFDGRDEWLAQESPWTIYVHGTTEYDEFQSWDVRISGDAGLGYRLIKTDLTTLTGRVGPGASREFGGLSNDWTPELVFNAQFEHQLSTRQKISLQTDYFPDPSQWSEFRLNNQASWAFVIDQDRNLSLKLSIVDRYASQSAPKKPNDLDYAATLLWSF